MAIDAVPIVPPWPGQDLPALIGLPGAGIGEGKRAVAAMRERIELDGALEGLDGAIELAQLLARAAEVLVGARVNRIQLDGLLGRGARQFRTRGEPEDGGEIRACGGGDGVEAPRFL